MSIAVVWFKRDLRLQDHLPLANAVSAGMPVLLVYCFEPFLIADPHYAKRHWRFVVESLEDIAKRVPRSALLVSEEDAIATFTKIHAAHQIHTVFSHQEVGLANTFARDKAFRMWCNQQNVSWQESAFGAVQRGITDRQNWDDNWRAVMRSDCVTINIDQVNWVRNAHLSCQLHRIKRRFGVSVQARQQGGETQAHQVLCDFFVQRGKDYAFSLSSPELSQHHCSRMSTYLAWGNVSLRQVYQSVLKHWRVPGWRKSLVALASRLHWHCHFIQKFESECDMEFRHINAGYNDLPRCEGKLAERRLEAWKTGNTGVPMVDACMRCLIATGYINFRMRAMLVSFLCHHLAIDWRAGVQHLARLFLDFEPGIHYSQFQMQAGVTGVNTIRIYSPVKQGEEKDPNGDFVRKWLPQLTDVPTPLIHSPWQLSEMEQMMYAVTLGEDYPMPIVDIKTSYKQAQDLLWQWRKKAKVVIESKRIVQRHVRPNG